MKLSMANYTIYRFIFLAINKKKDDIFMPSLII